MRITLKRRTPPQDQLTWCESLGASTISPHHLRVLPAGEQMKPSGGLSVQALCGREINGGWDLRVITVPSDELARAESSPREVNPPCPKCVAEARTWLEARPQGKGR